MAEKKNQEVKSNPQGRKKMMNRAKRPIPSHIREDDGGKAKRSSQIPKERKKMVNRAKRPNSKPH